MILQWSRRMGELRSRVQRFLKRPLPRGERAEGNATIGLIRRYATEESWDDPLLRKLTNDCASTLETLLPEMSKQSQQYYSEAAAILREILDETVGHGKRKRRRKRESAKSEGE